MNKRVLAVGAHPDDVEILCAGTLFHLAAEGFEIHVATMTLGDCGSTELGPGEIARVRRAEAEEACRLLGATYHYGGFHDFCIFDDDASNRRVTALVREVDPALVMTHSPEDYIADHETTSRLVRNACFYAPVPNYRTTAEPSRAIPHLYYAHPIEGVDIFGRPVDAGLYVDTSDVLERKAEMLACHRSQRDWLRAHHGMDEYLDSMRRWSEELGRRASSIAGREVASAEAFRQHLGHSYPRTNLLAEALGPRVIGQHRER
jgi:LmbE family N-acetylglucosaminyl deacetylase